MIVQFAKLSPTQNVTVLVRTPVPRAAQPEAANRLLAYDGVGGEQVGFVEKPVTPGAVCRLQMMGGEFCGNATMSLGALLAHDNDLADGACADFPLEVSGVSETVVCRIRREGDAYRGTVRMPVPEGMTRVVLPCDGGAAELDAVVLPGITHIVALTGSGLSREEVERRVREWNQIVRAEALGVLLYDEARQYVEPIVYVHATDSAVWERGCGSGTAALGCWQALREGKNAALDVAQPGGTIRVCAELSGGAVTDLTITGTVKIVATGEAYL